MLYLCLIIVYSGFGGSTLVDVIRTKAKRTELQTKMIASHLSLQLIQVPQSAQGYYLP